MRVAVPMVRSLLSRNGGFVSRVASYHDANHRVTTMNDLPVPEGDWQEAHQKKQSKYNAVLAGSFLFFVGTFSFMKQSGIVNFNFYAPKTYE